MHMLSWHLFLPRHVAFYSYFLSENCSSLIVTVDLLHCQLNLSQVLGVSVINSATVEKVIVFKI